MKKIQQLMRRAGAFVNPPPLPGDPGSMPQLRDYPVARPVRRSSQR